MERLIGKIKWFRGGRHGGALTSIGGISLNFSSTDEVAPTAFTQGDVVTYTAGDGATSPFADDVRAQPE